MPDSGFFVRDLHPGMGQAVAERTVFRRKEDGSFEDWGDVAARVAEGNALLIPEGQRSYDDWQLEYYEERDTLQWFISRGALMMSGRHLQHGDKGQPERNMEVFTNCATAPTSFLLFQLLLNGSGVGRCYDDALMLVDWDHAPTVWCVLDEDHPDYSDSRHLSARNARHMFEGSRDMMWYEVADSREGWAKALELVELAAFERVHKDKLLVLDFSKVRPSGAPIKGMQGRPSSGPVPLMNAFSKMSMIRGAGLPRWKQAMYVDHFMAECVLVGGARRAARMSTKFWKDRTVLDFISVKRPVEYDKLAFDEVVGLREGYVHAGEQPPLGFLWSSNNSVAVDQEFWEGVEKGDLWATQVFEMATGCAYADGTGEPGFVNVDKLNAKDEGWEDLYRGDYAGSAKFQVEDSTEIYLAKLAKRAKKMPYHYIVNPCGEIMLNVLGGYCALAALAPYQCRPKERAPARMNFETQKDFDRAWAGWLAEWDKTFEEAARVAVRAVMRVNTMDCIYKKEVLRTNRVGIGLIGIHEWVWARFGLSFREAISPDCEEAKEMRRVLSHVSRSILEEARSYAEEIGVTVPHTLTTIPPGGTISKLFGLTEGCHLPAMAHYLRWVQFRNDDPLVADYAAKGYPTRVLRQYKGHTIVGFPTRPTIAGIMPMDKIVTAAEATMVEQFKWLQLLEECWLEGNEEGCLAKDQKYGNQVSYTLKYDPDDISLWEFRQMVRQNQPYVRACSMMPQIDTVAFEYQPEQPISKAEFDRLSSEIVRATEEVDAATMGCENGVCAIEFNEQKGVMDDHGYA